MRSQALEDLFAQELEEIYDAEKQIYKGLGGMEKAATDPELKAGFHNHRKETKKQIERLEKSFLLLGEKPHGGNASGVAGLIKQSKNLAAGDDFDPAVVDAGLITSAQKIEHYEIAAYGCIRTHAGILGYKQIEDLLGDSQKEEEAADHLLTGIAQNSVNLHAAAAPYSQARTGLRHDGAVSLEHNSGGISFGKILFGFAIGGILSFLFTPKSGSEIRQSLRKTLG